MQVILDVSSLASIQQAQAFLRYLEQGAATAVESQVTATPQPPAELPSNVTPMPTPQPAPQPAPQPSAEPDQEVAALRARISDACAHLSHRMEEVGQVIHSQGVTKMSELNEEQLRLVCQTVEGMVGG